VLEPNKNTVPLKIWGEDLIDPGAISQMYQALRIPVAVRGALMPDAHLGYALPIGGVIELENAISPAFIGYDISCMMYMSILDISVDDFLTLRSSLAEDLKSVTYFGVGSQPDKPLNHPVMESELWKRAPVISGLKDKAWIQLGSSGGGNHFANLMLLDSDAGTEVVLLTHSGSRGTGHNLATHYTALANEYTRSVFRGMEKDYSWLSMETELGQEYLDAMELMGEYALANHQLIHENFSKRSGVRVSQTFWNRHNYAWVTPEGTLVHRKGATPAHAGEIGIIPGTSGTNSYFVKGLGNPDSLYSSSHGAGRNFSRAQAKREFDANHFNSWMTAQSILHYGIDTDETYQAYKNIESVMQAQTDLVEVLGKLSPQVVIMGGKSDDGD